MLAGDRVALARLITLAESRHSSLPTVLKRLAFQDKDSNVREAASKALRDLRS